MDEVVAEPLDDELLEILKEICKSYQSFLRAFVKSLAKQRSEGRLEKNLERAGILGAWLVYLLHLGYDVGFISLAIIREGLDRQLLVMRRQAFEYAVKAEYFLVHPEKAQQQYDALPLKMRQIFERIHAQRDAEPPPEFLESMAQYADKLPAGAGPKYGEVDMIAMLKELYPDDHLMSYAKNYMVPSAIIHGSWVGHLDVERRLPDEKTWFSHFSLLSNRNENVVAIAGSLIRLLVLTGDRFELRGGHWVSLIGRLNACIQRLYPGSGVTDLPVNVMALQSAEAQADRIKSGRENEAPA
jgi:hypothetical protein